MLQNEDYDINAKYKENKTLLHHAIETGFVILIKPILNIESCDLNVKNNRDLTPLHTAIRRGFVQIVELLIADKRCNLNIKDGRGKTPIYSVLDLPSSRYQEELVEILLTQAQCDLNVPDWQDTTVLQAAVLKGNILITDALLSNINCNTCIKNKEGKTILHIASEEAAKNAFRFASDDRMDIFGKDRLLVLEHVFNHAKANGFLLALDKFKRNALTLFITEYGDMSKYKSNKHHSDCIDCLTSDSSLVKSLDHTLVLAIEQSTTQTCK